MSGWRPTQIVRALHNGSSKHGEAKAFFEGEAHMVPTFEGPYWRASGRLDLWHYGSKVFSVDFDQDRVTDFGYHRYSQQTTAYVACCMRDLQRMRFLDVESLDRAYWPLDWTYDYAVSPKAKPRGAGWHEDMRDRFREKVPWVQWIDGKAWFHAPKWDTDLNTRYEVLRRELLEDRRHVWYTADWDKRGRWSKRFIDADAERRWKAHQKRIRCAS